jgi:hypothetical protein
MNIDCAKIISYRNNQLENDFRRAERHLKLDQEGKKDLLKMRRDLLNDTKYVTSHGALITGQLAGSIKLICEKFNDTLEFVVPEGKGISYSIKKGLDVTSDIIDQIKKGGDLESAFKAGFKNVLFNGKAKKIQNSITMVWDFADNIKEISEMEEDQKKLIEEVKTQLEHLDHAVQEYEKDINLTSKRLLFLEGTKENFDRYIRENCRSRPNLVC